MKMKKYMVYIDDGEDIFKLAIPAETEDQAREAAENGEEVIAVKDVTADYPISLYKVSHALKSAGFGKYEIDFIRVCLSRCGIAHAGRFSE